MKRGQFVVVVTLLGFIAAQLYKIADRPSADQQDIQLVLPTPSECVERPIAPHEVNQLSLPLEPLIIERVIIVLVPDDVLGTPDSSSQDQSIISPLPSPLYEDDLGQQSGYSY